MNTIVRSLQQIGILFGIFFLLFYLLILPVLSAFLPDEINLSVIGITVVSLLVAAFLALPLALLLKPDLSAGSFFYRFIVVYALSLPLYGFLIQIDYFDALSNIISYDGYIFINTLLVLVVVAIHAVPLVRLLKRYIVWGGAMVALLVLLLLLNSHLISRDDHPLGQFVLCAALFNALVWHLLVFTKHLKKWLCWVLVGIFGILYLLAAWVIYPRLVNYRIKIKQEQQTMLQEEALPQEEEEERQVNEADLYPWKGPQREPDSLKAYFRTYIELELGYDYYDSERHGQATIDFHQTFKAIFLESPDYLYLTENYGWNKANNTTEFLNDVALHIGRDNDRLLSFFFEFKDLIYSLISPEVYKGDLRTYVKMLLRTANMIDLPNYPAISDRINVELGNVGYVGNPMGVLQEILRQENFSMAQEDLAMENTTSVYWAYTFWARRYKERNTAAVYKILTSIDEHYTSLENGQDSQP